MSKPKATVVVNLDPEAQAQWRAAVEERDALRASNHNLQVKVAELQAQLEQCEVKHAKSHEEAADWRRMHTELLTELARQVEELRDKLRGIPRNGWGEAGDSPPRTD